ncbi:MAG: HAD family hydrolase [Anaerolineales bacterium]|jgi:HAD superfamily hydrolase (TIGR01509 family)
MPILEGIRAIIFDLDGLMVDSEPIALEVWREVLQPFGVHLSAEVYSRVIGLEPRRGAGMMIDEFNLPLTVEALLETYWKHRTAVMERRIQPQPGLLEVVDTFEEKGYRLGVASNSPSFYVRRILAAIRLDERLVCAVGSDQVGSGKPAPDVYLAAAHCLDVPPQVCLAIEDSPAGVSAACAAGMRCVAIPNPELHHGDFSQADAVFDSLTDFYKFLAR